MGKKKDAEAFIGRALIKDLARRNRGRKHVANNSMLHTTEVQDGSDWGRLNLRSVTEESSFQEFLSTAELAGAEFQAEKLNIKIIDPRTNTGLLTEKEKRAAKDAHERNRDLIKIPRRPDWNRSMATEELNQQEREHFLEWRRTLAHLEETNDILLTPYEKNLEFWRQLWRVIEKSDVIVQIVDARNPLLFRCEDLENYVKEVSQEKMNMILINKADFLTEKQRQHWADYFSGIGVRVMFFSAVLAASETKTTDDGDGEVVAAVKGDIEKLEEAVNVTEEKLEAITKQIEEKFNIEATVRNSSELLTRERLIEVFRRIHTGKKVTTNLTTIGLVGYPNVGKSSTINALLSAKKVSVSATPGKTKHFQTWRLTDDILLCDCPGLVMPSFVFTKAEMIINGILPIDQMRDHVPPVSLVATLIPRHVIEDTYGIMLPAPREGEDPERAPFAEEVLNSYGYHRGFMTANGQPDNPRSARYFLKDFVNGKLLYCLAPPGVEQSEYHTWPERNRSQATKRVLTPREARAINANHTTSEEVDKAFFEKRNYGAHVKGKSLISVNSAGTSGEKPWKKHGNKNKKEKLRRVYAHLDQH